MPGGRPAVQQQLEVDDKGRRGLLHMRPTTRALAAVCSTCRGSMGAVRFAAA